MSAPHAMGGGRSHTILPAAQPIGAALSGAPNGGWIEVADLVWAAIHDGRVVAWVCWDEGPADYWCLVRAGCPEVRESLGASTGHPDMTSEEIREDTLAALAAAGKLLERPPVSAEHEISRAP